MMRHPRERNPFRSPISRRDFLRRSAGAAVVLSGTGSLLAACGESIFSAPTGPSASPTGFKVASPDDPATLAIAGDNEAIASGLDHEAGPLRIYNWDEYIWPRVTKQFGKEFGVEVETSTFYNMEEGVAKLRTGQVDFDIFFPTIDYIPKLVAAGLLQPLNHDYIPNLERNIWPQLVNPFYDQGSRYSVPYVVYTTGIGWRTDLASEDIPAMVNPYEILWDPAHRGKVGIYDDYREAMVMVLLKNGITELNTDDPAHLELVKKDLLEMTEAVNVRTTVDGAYSRLPEGVFAIHQAWSGDMVAAPYYMPEAEYGDPNRVLRYWWPEDGKGLVGSDTIVIPRSAKNPVLAHQFLNFLLDDKHAIDNFGFVGYQPPLKSIDPDRMVEEGYVLETLRPAVVQEDYFKTGYVYLSLPPEVDQLWLNAWSEFKAGA